MHEWEQIDEGIAYCLHCAATTTWGANEECMNPLTQSKNSANIKEPPGIPRPPAQPKGQADGSIPHGVNDQEIENLKRLLASVSQRLDALKSR